MTTLDETSLSQRTRAATDNVHRGIDKAADTLHDTTENAAASAIKFASSANRGVDKLKEKEERLRTTTADYAVKHPLRSIMLGLGAGFLLAKVMQRKSV